jgi:hypothetical protein
MKVQSHEEYNAKPRNNPTADTEERHKLRSEGWAQRHGSISIKGQEEVRRAAISPGSPHLQNCSSTSKAKSAFTHSVVHSFIQADPQSD